MIILLLTRSAAIGPRGRNDNGKGVVGLISSIRVVIGSESLIAGECLSLGISAMPGFEVAGVAGKGEPMGALMERLPHLVALYFPSNQGMALQLTREITDHTPGTKVILLGLDDSEAAPLDGIEAGASGWLARSASLGDLRLLLGKVSEGEVVCSPRLAYKMFERVSELAANSLLSEGAASALTMREMEVMELIAQDKSNEQIAAQLCLSVHTVKRYVHSLLEKLRVGSRGQLAAASGGLESAAFLTSRAPAGHSRDDERPAALHLTSGAF